MLPRNFDILDLLRVSLRLFKSVAQSGHGVVTKHTKIYTTKISLVDTHR